jgi:hypothetical protein
VVAPTLGILLENLGSRRSAVVALQRFVKASADETTYSKRSSDATLSSNFIERVSIVAGCFVGMRANVELIEKYQFNPTRGGSPR